LEDERFVEIVVGLDGDGGAQQAAMRRAFSAFFTMSEFIKKGC